MNEVYNVEQAYIHKKEGSGIKVECPLPRLEGDK